MSEIEFDAWETPFVDGDLAIMEVRYGNGGLDEKYIKEKIGFRVPEKYSVGYEDLVVRLFHKEEMAVYSLMFKDVAGFRVLDENGLLQLWDEMNKQSSRFAKSTFRVRNHLWMTESPLAFLGAKDSWSFVIATDTTCVEVICLEAPDICFEEAVTGYSLE